MPTSTAQFDEEPPPPAVATPAAVDLTPDDFYLEGPFMVFTAAYHLKRGFCCNSECRHCPYK